MVDRPMTAPAAKAGDDRHLVGRDVPVVRDRLPPVAEGLAILGDEVAATIASTRSAEPRHAARRRGAERAHHAQVRRSKEQAAEGRSQLLAIAERAGASLSWSGEGTPPPAMMWNTRAAHTLLVHALRDYDAETEVRLKLALFAAHFQHRRNVSDHAVLLDVAESAGLDRARAQAALDDPELAAIVVAGEQQAWDWNISGVPAMVVNGKYLIPGAQEPDVYANALRRVIAREAAGAGQIPE
jgi:predicted DsbA family dithiol-disulfide isomerase